MAVFGRGWGPAELILRDIDSDDLVQAVAIETDVGLDEIGNNTLV